MPILTDGCYRWSRFWGQWFSSGELNECHFPFWLTFLMFTSKFWPLWSKFGLSFSKPILWGLKPIQKIEKSKFYTLKKLRPKFTSEISKFWSYIILELASALILALDIVWQ
jgi:hypothetical protein